MPINEDILDCFPLNNFKCSFTDLYVFVKTPLKSEENSYIEQTDYSKHFPDTAYSLSWQKHVITAYCLVTCTFIQNTTVQC